MIVVTGDKAIHKKIWFYIRNLYLFNKRTIVIDAANRFDPYLISRISLSQRISPYLVLENIIIARAFTPFQLLKLIEKVKFYNNIPLLCIGVTNLFEDENISLTYSWKIFKKSILMIKKLKRISILTADNEISFRNFIPFLKNESKVFIKESKVIKPETKNGEKKLWEGQLHHLLQY